MRETSLYLFIFNEPFNIDWMQLVTNNLDPVRNSSINTKSAEFKYSMKAIIEKTFDIGLIQVGHYEMFIE